MPHKSLHERRIFWIAVVSPPIVWFLNLSITYGFALRACQRGNVLPIYMSTFVSVILAAAVLAFAHHEWKRLGKPRRALDPRDRGIAEFLSAGARLLSAFFLTVIVAATLPPLLFGPCLR